MCKEPYAPVVWGQRAGNPLSTGFPTAAPCCTRSSLPSEVPEQSYQFRMSFTQLVNKAFVETRPYDLYFQ